MGPNTLFGARGNSEDVIGSFRIPIDESVWYEEAGTLLIYDYLDTYLVFATFKLFFWD